MSSTQVQRLTLADQVSAELEAEVLALPAGTSLPSEAALAERFGVNRLVIREVTKTLQARGLLQVRQGKPAVVVDSTHILLSDYFRLSMMRDRDAELELLEVRRALEVFFAGVAAKRATAAAIELMRDLVEEMATLREAAIEPAARAAFMEADLRFHSTLATASGNSCAEVILAALSVPLRRSRARSLEGAFRLGDLIEAVEAHRRILAAVEDRDSQAARLEMIRHLDQTERDLRAAGVIEAASSTPGRAKSRRRGASQ